MPSSVLLLWLDGPMQSWGTRARWDVRDTGGEPTKSGVIGLIGCSMGLRRRDSKLEEVDHSLLFGVRVDCRGVIATDYHTVTGYHRTAEGEFKRKGGSSKSLAAAQEHDENTVVSPRDYLHDASFLVALMVKPEYQASNQNLLSDISQCLQAPKWPLYLGRKSCVPSRPIFARLATEYQDIEHALKAEPMALRLKEQQPPKLEAWVECDDGEYERQDAMRLNQLRFYDFRRCKRIEIDINSLGRPA